MLGELLLLEEGRLKSLISVQLLSLKWIKPGDVGNQ